MSNFPGAPLNKFVSGQQVMVANTRLTIAHPFGVKPIAYDCYLVCTTANFNWAVGDEVQLAASTQYVGGDAGITASADASNIYVDIVATGSIYVLNKSTRTLTPITLASWRLIVKAIN